MQIPREFPLLWLMQFTNNTQLKNKQLKKKNTFHIYHLTRHISPELYVCVYVWGEGERKGRESQLL